MAQENATDRQLRLIEKIATCLNFITPKCVLIDKSIASAWIALGLASLNEIELAQIKAKPSNLDESELNRLVLKLSKISEVPAPSNHDKETLRQWLKVFAGAFTTPVADKVLQYWHRALFYRDLNAFTGDKTPPISTKPVLDDLPNTLPTLSKDFKAPRSCKPSDSVALLIAFAPSVGKSHATALLGIPLAYNKETHSLVPPSTGAIPFFNREWLEPPDPESVKDIYFGSVYDCDEFFSNNSPPKEASWPEYWSYVEQFVCKITGHSNPLPNLAPFIHRRDTVWKIVEWDAGGASKKIAAAYQRAMEGQLPSLLSCICDKAQLPGHFDLADALKNSDALLGHIDTFSSKKEIRLGFGLERSQRIAATAMTQVPNGKLLTVNGPPGTGKTSFLRAVIGTEYVQAALRGGAPSLILATAATNKAVTNIIDSFAEIASPEMQPDWSSRWLPDLPSYGWFYPAASKSGDEFLRFMVLGTERGDDENYRIIMKMAAANFFAAQKQIRHWMEKDFLDLHRRVLGLSKAAENATQAADMIRAKLSQSVAQMHAIQTSFRKCLELPLKLENFRRSESEWQHIKELHLQQGSRLEQELQQLTDKMVLLNKVVSQLREAKLLRKKCSGLLYNVTCLIFGDKLGAKAQLLENIAVDGMNLVNPETLISRRDILDQAMRQQEQILRKVSDIKEQLQSERKQIDTAQIMLQEWRKWREAVAGVLSQLGEYGENLGDQLAQWEEERFPYEHDLELRLEEALDKSFRFNHFHMAARYWEARWLTDTPTPQDETDILLNLRRAAMLAPVIVSTVYTLPGITPKEFEFADLLIFDESGQASPEIGAACFAFAKRAIVVGDIYQLKPVWNVGKEADTRLRTDIGIEDMPEALNVSSGSIMTVAQTHTALSTNGGDKLGAGVGLVAHYRCRADIIEYCRRLIYGESLLPVRLEEPPNNQSSFLYPPMAWVAVEPKKSAQKQGGSWVNYDQINEIVYWLQHDTPRILDHYGVSHISDVVALIAPFRAQAIALRNEIKKSLGEDEANAMVINTVHALQGAEKPIVAFTLTQDEGNFFVDREGPNLLNVAASRAKDCFILFASSFILQPDINGRATNTKRENGDLTPLGLLVKYMNENGRRLYPREVVIIEAPGKVARIEEALGLTAHVVATGGHFRRLRVINDKLQAEITNEVTYNDLQSTTRDLRQIDNFYIATDDDDDGEEIAWHVQEVLRSQGVTDPNRIRRMRFYSLTSADIRQAHKLALPGIDARKVRGNLLRSLFDAALHEQLQSAKIQASRPQLALLQEISEREKESGDWQLKVHGSVGEKNVTAYVLDSTATRPAKYDNAEAAKAAFSSIPLGTVNHVSSREYKVILPRYPASTTAQMIISGYERYQWAPAKTMSALNSLYLGHAAPSSYGIGIEDDDVQITGES